MKSILLTTTLLLTTFATKCCGTYCRVLKAEPVSQEEGMNILKSISEYKTDEDLANDTISATFKSETRKETDSTNITHLNGGMYYNPSQNEMYVHIVGSEQIDLEYGRSESWLLNEGRFTYSVTTEMGKVESYRVKEYETKKEAFEAIGTGFGFAISLAITVGYGLPQVAEELYEDLYGIINGKDLEGSDIPDEEKSELLDCQFLSTGEPGNLQYNIIIKDEDGKVSEYHAKYENYYATEYSFSDDEGTYGEWNFDFNAQVERVPLPEKPEDSTSNN